MRTQASKRAESFAAQLIGRYARSGARRRWIELLLPSAGLFATSIVNSYRLALCVSSPRSRSAAKWERRAAPQSRQQIARSLESMPPWQRPSALRTVVQETTLTRVVQRLQRIETRANHAASMTAMATRADSSTTQLQAAAENRQPSPPPAAQMPLRQPVAAANPAIAQQTNNAPSSTPGGNPRVPAKTGGGAVSEHEIERLADRVISSIDRRIVAQRERFGRP
jgi:hypothetical protein